jgi:hypothetical protein
MDYVCEGDLMYIALDQNHNSFIFCNILVNILQGFIVIDRFMVP